MTLRGLSRGLLASGAVLYLIYLGLVIAAAPSREEVQIILPVRWSWMADTGLLLLAIGFVFEAARRSGWRRLGPLATLTVLIPIVFAILGIAQIVAMRVEINRVALPDGRIVMLTLEPGFTDAVYGLWWQYGWRWRAVFQASYEISYSEDHEFTDDPGLVLSPDRRFLLIRRGGIWTDCWKVGRDLGTCLNDIADPVTDRAAWLDRSDRITAAIGLAPSHAHLDR